MKADRSHATTCTAVLLLAAHSALLAWGVYRHAPVMDEPGQLVAGISHWEFGKFELYRVTGPIVRLVAALPVMASGYQMDWTVSYHSRPDSRAEGPLGRNFLRANSSNACWMFSLARWACIPISLLGGYICFRWALQLYGAAAGLLALSLWCFSPNILAHAQLITTDAAGAAFSVAAAWLLRGWLIRSTWRRAVLAGVALGLAQLTKATFLVFYPLWPVLWILWRWNENVKQSPRENRQTTVHGRTGPTEPRTRWRTDAAQMAAILMAGLYVLNLGYGFEGTLGRLGNYGFVSASLAGERAEGQLSGNRFAETWAASLRVPVPENYLRGIDVQRAQFEGGKQSYLRGEWRRGGWWYYYVYGLAIKVPVGTWLLFFIACILTVQCTTAVDIREEVLLIAPAIVVLVLVSSQTGINKNLRYVLAILPFLFIWIGRVGAPPVLRRMAFAVPSAIALLWSVGSSLYVYPHSLSYFNELVSGPERGHEHLLHSNIDWGQDLLYLRDWLEDHAEASPLHFAYRGSVDPRLVGIQFRLPPRGPALHERPAPEAEAQELGPHPGWYALSVSALRGDSYCISDGSNRPLPGSDYTYFLRFSPVAMAGYSIYIYHIKSDEANRVRRELGLPELRPDPPAKSEGDTR